jgi:quinol monooxygenase YgiN
MIHVLVQVTVADFERFWSGFQTRGRPLRERHGSKRARVFRHADDPDRVTILFGWASREHFERFLQDPEVRASMAQGGTLGAPAITYLEQAGELEA